MRISLIPRQIAFSRAHIYNKSGYRILQSTLTGHTLIPFKLALKNIICYKYCLKIVIFSDKNHSGHRILTIQKHHSLIWIFFSNELLTFISSPPHGHSAPASCLNSLLLLYSDIILSSTVLFMVIFQMLCINLLLPRVSSKLKSSLTSSRQQWVVISALHLTLMFSHTSILLGPVLPLCPDLCQF